MINTIPVILIFDVGKTNKKITLYNKSYQIVYQKETNLTESVDEDGYVCEDITNLTNWILQCINELKNMNEFDIKLIHFTSYGASLVFIDKEGAIVAPLYNYLKPLKKSTKNLFELKYGPIKTICLQTASPDLDNLNSGMQIFRMKFEKPEIYSKIKWILHLPQYLNYLIHKDIASDITSIGCHTMMWDYKLNTYHQWVIKEGIDKLLPPIKTHVGLHDSSAALLAYTSLLNTPFILISTGTWCISLNPFNHSMLTSEDLNNDTLFYLSIENKPVKAARLNAGKMHEIELEKLKSQNLNKLDFKIQYEKLIDKIIIEQVKSTNLILKGTNIKNIYIDGGFSKNEIYMKGLAKAYANFNVFAANIPHASSVGAAIIMHEKWNNEKLNRDYIELKNYSYRNELY